MRILHIVPAIFGAGGVIGGAERYAFELARHMGEQATTTLTAFGDRNEERHIGNLRLHVLAPCCYVKGERSNPLSASLIPEIRRADIVHCHQQHVVSSSLASLICRVTGRKVFVSDLGGGGWDVSGYVSTDRWYHGHLHISEYSRIVFGHVGKPWAHVIYGGVDTEKFSPAEETRHDGPVLFVGRLLPHKGIDDLIRAMPADVPLEIIGRPYDKKYFEDLQHLAAGKQVVFHQECDDTALVDAYRRALCIVLPSVYKTMYGQTSKVPELLGQTVLEAMACGTPAICTTVASLPEIVQEGVTGFLVPPNSPDTLRERILWLRDHPDDTRRMGQCARQHILSRFTWSSVVDRCLAIYAS